MELAKNKIDSAMSVDEAEDDPAAQVEILQFEVSLLYLSLI